MSISRFYYLYYTLVLTRYFCSRGQFPGRTSCALNSCERAAAAPAQPQVQAHERH